MFSPSQLTEKGIHHQAKNLDLKKAYDSLPHKALWTSLKKIGVFDLLTDIIKSFKDNMSAQV